MQGKNVLYPFGFRAILRSLTNGRPLGRSDGDLEVATLYSDYYAKAEGYDTWDFKQRVFRSAIRLFGNNFNLWALQQLDSPYINDKCVRCIADTVKFIATGDRDMVVIHWGDLLDADPVEVTTPSSKLRVELRKQLSSLVSADGPGFLYRWLKHENGFDDLLLSLSIFFGPDRNPEDRNAILNSSPKNPQTQRLNKLLNS